jgi:hypothetical protein
MDKVLIHNIELPGQGYKKTIPVSSRDGKERFDIDINRSGKIKLTRSTLQERYAVRVILVRVDFDETKPHKTPDLMEQ